MVEFLEGFFATPETTDDQALLPRDEATQFLIAQLREQPYGVLLSALQEVTELPPVAPLPDTGRELVGVTFLRGAVLPVIDAGALLQGAATQRSEHCRLLVLRTEHEPVGLLVDRVRDVLRVNPEHIEAVDTTTPFITGVVREPLSGPTDEEWPIIDVSEILDWLESRAWLNGPSR